ncbi:uncharacterized protein LOC121040136 [Herpailurus yagouaroundi]|uniref:uncharacterized protein LOC121040136 n=1 Tax=Herpailurus yagouaroundi TaxID=1608482 RepID=UPI001AD60BEE|nr:uncharacterized protein LOC121040136 [Puma yagouaroundi]
MQGNGCAAHKCTHRVCSRQVHTRTVHTHHVHSYHAQAHITPRVLTLHPRHSYHTRTTCVHTPCTHTPHVLILHARAHRVLLPHTRTRHVHPTTCTRATHTHVLTCIKKGYLFRATRESSSRHGAPPRVLGGRRRPLPPVAAGSPPQPTGSVGTDMSAGRTCSSLSPTRCRPMIPEEAGLCSTSCLRLVPNTLCEPAPAFPLWSNCPSVYHVRITGIYHSFIIGQGSDICHRLSACIRGSLPGLTLCRGRTGSCHVTCHCLPTFRHKALGSLCPSPEVSHLSEGPCLLLGNGRGDRPGCKTCVLLSRCLFLGRVCGQRGRTGTPTRTHLCALLRDRGAMPTPPVPPPWARLPALSVSTSALHVSGSDFPPSLLVERDRASRSLDSSQRHAQGHGSLLSRLHVFATSVSFLVCPFCEDACVLTARCFFSWKALFYLGTTPSWSHVVPHRVDEPWPTQPASRMLAFSWLPGLHDSQQSCLNNLMHVYFHAVRGASLWRIPTSGNARSRGSVDPFGWVLPHCPALLPSLVWWWGNGASGLCFVLFFSFLMFI